MNLFDNLEKITYKGYIKKFPFHLGLDINIEDYLKNIAEQTSLESVGGGGPSSKKITKRYLVISKPNQ
jgi:hypothetical protein